jgi:penicillin-binding protein 1C
MIIYLVIPMPLFNDPHSTIIIDKNGKLLSTKIANDGQWRFPKVDSIPVNFIEAIRYFEDEYFYWHPGVNPVSILRAGYQNISSGRVKSGGSTISMQVIRLSRKNKKRTFIEKFVEIIKALKLEILYSKEEILQFYVSNAPYGGNIVGIEAASWRYFKRPLHLLSWAEYATLAVLPNAPSLIHPGRNRNLLLQKRNRLLHKLYNNKVLDSVTYSLALQEDIPLKPQPFPNEAFHLLDFAIKSGKEGQRIKTSIDKSIQVALSKKLDNYINVISQNEIRNACAIVVSLKDTSIKAYIGNTKNQPSGARFVDLIQAPRSSGSILKPFLYGKAMDDGMIQSTTLLRDVPISISKFSPSNFDKRFEGVVPASEALSRSLNIPATLLLRDYGIVPFYGDLQDFGFTSINRSAGNYGLTLVLGGAEVTLWDLAKAYSHQAMALREYNKENTKVKGLQLWVGDERFAKPKSAISEGGWWLISEALTNVQRPGLDQNWKHFSSSRRIAWKTGTSHGFRDAWAVGYDSEYLVGIWVGNAEGDGRPGLTGVSTAAPLMFQFFQRLKNSGWFSKPETSLKLITICEKSGMSPNQFCPKKEVEIPKKAKITNRCTLHKNIILNTKNERVYLDCATTAVKDTVWFSLDPVAAHYYKFSHQNYEPLPAFSSNCKKGDTNMLDIIYPPDKAEIIVPKDFDGKEEKILVEAAHVNEKSKLYWHLDNLYVGSTVNKHQMLLELDIGVHSLLIIDEWGNTARSKFRIYK